GAARDVVREVRVVRVPELHAIALGHDRPQHAVEVRVLEGVPSFHAMHLAVQADDRRLATAEVEVGCAPLYSGAEELLEGGAGFLAPREILNVVERRSR